MSAIFYIISRHSLAFLNTYNNCLYLSSGFPLWPSIILIVISMFRLMTDTNHKSPKPFTGAGANQHPGDY